MPSQIEGLSGEHRIAALVEVVTFSGPLPDDGPHHRRPERPLLHLGLDGNREQSPQGRSQCVDLRGREARRAERRTRHSRHHHDWRAFLDLL